jgi:tetratricopeptide (TPR) repeat protein
LYFAHRFEDATEQCHIALSLDPNFLSVHANLYEIYTAMGRYSEAFDEYFTIKRLREGRTSQEEPANDKELRQAFAVGGIKLFWQVLTVQLAQQREQYYTRAKNYARLGDRNKAIESLISGSSV